MRIRVRIVTALASGFLVALVALPAVAKSRDRASENRAARWSAMPEDERNQMRERYDAFLHLEPLERAALSLQAERLEHLERGLLGRLKTSHLETLEALPVAKRLAVVDEMVLQEARTTARRILRKLPSDIRERLESASPQDRALFLQRYKAQESKRIERAYRHLANVLDLNEDETQRLQSIGIDRRRQAFLELAAMRVRAAVAESGVPAGIATEIWPRISSMDDLEFLESILWLRELHPGFGGLQAETSSTDTASGALVHQRESMKRLRGTFRIADRERIKFADLEPADRRRELEQLQRKRALRVMREENLVQEPMLTQLEQCSQREFFLTVRPIIMGKPIPRSMGQPHPPAFAGPPGQAPDPGQGQAQGQDL